MSQDPLTCLWGDLLNKDAKVSAESILLLVQCALVLLNSSHAMSHEHRKGGLGSKQGSNLFGPDFQEKASKRIELDKAMSKVSLPSSAGPASKKRKFGQDRPDLRKFLDRSSSARYGSGKAQCQLSYQTPKRFQSRKYFQTRPHTQDKTKSFKLSVD